MRRWMLFLLVPLLSGCAQCPDYGYLSTWQDDDALAALTAFIEADDDPHDAVDGHIDAPGHRSPVLQAGLVYRMGIREGTWGPDVVGLTFDLRSQDNGTSLFEVRAGYGLDQIGITDWDVQQATHIALQELGWPAGDDRDNAARNIAFDGSAILEGPFDVEAAFDGYEVQKPLRHLIARGDPGMASSSLVWVGPWQTHMHLADASVRVDDGDATWRVTAWEDGTVLFHHAVAWGGDNPDVDRARHEAAMARILPQLGLDVPAAPFTDPGTFHLECIY